MATEVVRDLADTIIGGGLEAEETDSEPSVETIRARDSNLNQLGNSSYVLTADDSVFSRDVDRWITGDSSPTNTGIQGRPRVTSTQRSALATTSSLDTAGVWYFAAMVLPFISVNDTVLWRCTPSTVLGTAELLLIQVARLCALARSQLRRLAREQAARDLFATAMDILLVIYAMGFLVLSLYQASLIGH